MNIQQKTQSVVGYVLALAARYNIVHRRSHLDEWTDAVTRLAGDEVELDEVDCLITELAKATIITDREMITPSLRIWMREAPLEL